MLMDVEKNNVLFIPAHTRTQEHYHIAIAYVSGIAGVIVAE